MGVSQCLNKPLQMTLHTVNFLLRSLTVTLTVLLFWIYFYILTLVFVLHWLSLHWEILVMLLPQFPLTFHQTQMGFPVSLYSFWLFSCWLGSLCDHLRDVPWKNIFKLGASAAAASEFGVWVLVWNDVYIPHCKLQVNPHSFPWLSASCAAAIIYRNPFFCLYQQNESSESKGNFR